MARLRTFWPDAQSGKTSLWLGVVGLGSWVILPLVTSIFGKIFPVTDSFIMPLIGVILMAIAAVANLMTYFFMRQRSLSNLVMLALTVFWFALTLTFLVGEGLAGI